MPIYSAFAVPALLQRMRVTDPDNHRCFHCLLLLVHGPHPVSRAWLAWTAKHLVTLVCAGVATGVKLCPRELGGRAGAVIHPASGLLVDPASVIARRMLQPALLIFSPSLQNRAGIGLLAPRE